MRIRLLAPVARLFGRVLSGQGVLLFLIGSASAQFTDLQPGRNFPSAELAFGANRSENVDVGDVDLDGDLDVIVANGGDFGDEPNRLFINQGGGQGGTQGTFIDETASRLLGVPADTSRDIEFVDIDADGDLDLYVSNRGGNTTGQPSRFHVNLGGLQGGAPGFFVEDTEARGGAQVLGGNAGPWQDWSCDCDFGDLDDDGDLDLFHTSYGPSVDGSEDSRVFLNDGTGVFNELWPWADAAADTAWHTLDADLVDLDGDLDLDIVVASRNSQARVFHNNTRDPLPGSTTLFTDTTQVSLLDQGAAFSGGSNYECEAGDLDGDGDIDIWMVSYNTFFERVLINQGLEAGVGVRFTASGVGAEPERIFGDPLQDEHEVDLLDFDGDGDLDVFAASFTGTNFLYANGTAQGLVGQMHRTGTPIGGSLYGDPEVPLFGNTGPSLDGEAADLDGDGDPDILLTNDGALGNRLWRNALGIPDVHAPVLHLVVSEGTASGGVAVHVQLRDNTAAYLVALSDVRLVYTLDGGPEVSLRMLSQGGWQFRGVLPCAVGCVEWRVEASDAAGNTTVSAITAVGSCGGAWVSLGEALAGSEGLPCLVGSGPLSAGSAGGLALSSAAPAAPALLFVSLSSVPTPFKGGTLLTVPLLLGVDLLTDATGGLSLPFAWPAGVPAGLELFVQVAILDAQAVKGVSLSNALMGTAS